MDKKDLRRHLLEKRNNISVAERQDKSARIAERLQELEIYREAYTVLFYVSLGNEVDTHQLIKDALKTKKVAAPLVDKKNLAIKQIESFNQLKTGFKNILEPDANLPSVSLKDINLVIVPGVAYDKKHFRLGYGGGFYDRLLIQPPTTNHQPPISIGLAFEEQIVDELPIEAYDQKVDFIVTEKRII